MFETLRYGLPLLDAAQAQKHVTVNEALARTDALSAARVESAVLSVPPGAPVDGEVYIVGPAATGVWTGADGKLALYVNGGWEIVEPFFGQRVWIADERAAAMFLDGAWVRGHAAGSLGGAATLVRIAEVDHLLSAATVSTTAAIIPDMAVVLGATGRVIEAITGASAWSLGVSGDPARYGSGYGIALNSIAQGLTPQPQSYSGATALEITSADVAFTGGTIRLSVHYLEISPPIGV